MPICVWVYVSSSFLKTEQQAVSLPGDVHNSSQGRRFFASKSILLVPLGVVSGPASPGRQIMQQRESWISQQNFWGQPGRQGVRRTDTNQKEMEGKAGEWGEDPRGEQGRDSTEGHGQCKFPMVRHGFWSPRIGHVWAFICFLLCAITVPTAPNLQWSLLTQ